LELALFPVKSKTLPAAKLEFGLLRADWRRRSLPVCPTYVAETTCLPPSDFSKATFHWYERGRLRSDENAKIVPVYGGLGERTGRNGVASAIGRETPAKNPLPKLGKLEVICPDSPTPRS